MLRRSSFVVALCAGLLGVERIALAQAAAPDAPAPDANQAGDITILVKETPPVRIAFVEHQGPYWTLGPVFDLVREAMAKQNEDGPMFIRYHTDPRKVPAAALKSDVGFVLDGAGDSSSPLTMDRRPAEKVAYVLAPSPHGTTSRFYALLYDWAEQNGYQATGGPLDVYWGRSDKEVVEIQLPITEASQVAQARDEVAQPKLDQPAERDESGQQTSEVAPINRGTIAPLAPAEPTQRNETPPEIRPEPRDNESIADAPSQPPTGEPIRQMPQPRETQDGVVEIQIRRPESINPQADPEEYIQRAVETPPRPNAPPVQATQIEPNAEKQRVPPEPPNPLPDLEDSPLVAAAIARADIALRFAERNFNGLANTILPEGTRLDPEMQVWVGQMAYRLLAVGRGMRQKFGEDADDVQYVSAALLERWRTFLPPSADPLALASRSSSKITDPHQKDIIRRADLLLGRIALDGSDKEAATQEVVEMLQEVMEVIRSRP